MWVARYTLGLLMQQDGNPQPALGCFQALLSPAFEALPNTFQIAALTGLASCTSQLGRRTEAVRCAATATRDRRSPLRMPTTREQRCSAEPTCPRSSDVCLPVSVMVTARGV